MIWIFVVVSALVAFVVAAVAVGSVTAAQAGKSRPAVYGSLVVVTDDEPIAFILGRADDAEVEITDEQIVAILTAQEGYYRAIGAYGPEVSGPDDPAPSRTMDA